MTKKEAIKYLQQLYPNGGHCWLDEQRIEAIGIAINALQEEPVSEDLEKACDKAEKFISEHTRNCSNVFVNPQLGGTEENHPWLSPDQARKAVEIARKEMIEKVCEFLDNDLCCYIKAQDFTIEHQRLENDLKQAMKNE